MNIYYNPTQLYLTIEYPYERFDLRNIYYNPTQLCLTIEYPY